MEKLSEKRRKAIVSLHRKRVRKAERQYLIEGIRLIHSAQNANVKLSELLVTKDALGKTAVQSLVESFHGPVYEADHKAFASVSDVVTSQGIIAVAEQADEISGQLSRSRLLIALDRIQDPGNVGTIIRSAAWFGVDGVISGKGTADFYNSKTIRATMGGLWDVERYETQDLLGPIQALKRGGFNIYTTELKGVIFEEWRPQFPAVVVLGSEGHGVSDEIRQLAHEGICIPGAGKPGVESLNVSVAAGIVMQRAAAFL